MSEEKTSAPGRKKKTKKKPRYAPGSRAGKGGRKPTVEQKFKNPAVINLIEYLLEDHRSMPYIASKIGVPLRSLERFKEENPQYWRDRSEVMATADEDVENAMLMRARGFYKKLPTKLDCDGQPIEWENKYYPPSDRAAAFWLSNRQPQKWKMRVEHNVALEELPLSVSFTRAPDRPPEPPKEESPNVLGDEQGTSRT